jgi:hypothetical protein
MHSNGTTNKRNTGIVQKGCAARPDKEATTYKITTA